MKKSASKKQTRLEKIMTEKLRIYPVFLPHAGCPFRCVYCNQRAVTACHATGSTSTASGSAFIDHVLDHLTQVGEDARRAAVPGEIAFYGGTFTCLPPDTLKKILEASSPWVEEGVFTGIRFSTRPDAITPEICGLIEDYPVRTIELGVQSMCDEVLSQSRRGYTTEEVRNAAASVKAHGWALGLQMMPGLPGDTRRRFLESVTRVIGLSPDLVRLYPTLVLQDTLLAEWHRNGTYRPLTLHEAIIWCVPAYNAFLEADIPVARMGLHADPELWKPGKVVGGPHHPSFGYLVRVYWWREQVDKKLKTEKEPKQKRRLILRIPQRSLSEVVGPHRTNILYWQDKWRIDEVKVKGDAEMQARCFVCEWERKEREE